MADCGEEAFKNGASASVANTNCRRTGFISALLLFSLSPRPEDNQTAALKAQSPATYLLARQRMLIPSMTSARLSSLQTIKSDVRKPSARLSTGRGILLGEQSAAGAAPMKAMLFMAQNNDHLVRAACLNRKKIRHPSVTAIGP